MPAVTLFGALGGMGWQGVRIASAGHVGGQWGMDWMRWSGWFVLCSAWRMVICVLDEGARGAGWFVLCSAWRVVICVLDEGARRPGMAFYYIYRNISSNRSLTLAP